MEMTMSDIEWARAQMKAAGLVQPTQAAVEKLLKALDAMQLSITAENDVVSTFAKLAVGTALVAEQETVDEVWEQARAGNLVLADEVRVKTDAYAGELGVAHNGRRGRVVGIRYGNIYIKYYGVSGDGMHHKPAALEKRVR